MSDSEFDEEEITRWMDGELEGDDLVAFEQRVRDKAPELLEAKKKATVTGDLLRTHVPRDQEPPHADFFNARIMKEIRQDQSSVEASSDPGSEEVGWFGWARIPWMIAAAATVVAAIAVLQNFSGTSRGSGFADTYVPGAGVVAETWFSEEAGALVIELEGLDDIPDSREIRGENLASYAPDLEGGATVLNSVRDRGSYVLLVDGMQQPSFHRIGKEGVLR